MSTPDQKTGTFEALAIGVAGILSPLEEDLKDGKTRVLLTQLGLQLPPSADGVTAFADAADRMRTATVQMPQQIEDLIGHIDNDNDAQILQSGQDLLRSIVDTIHGIADLAAAVRGLGASTGIAAATLNNFADNLPRKLIDYLVVRNIEGIPVVPEVLELVGVIERNLRNSGSPDPALPEFTEYALHLNHATDFVSSPQERLQTLYDWGLPGFDGSRLLPLLQSLLSKAGIPAVIDDTVSPPVLDALVFEISAKTDAPKGLLLHAVKAIDIERGIPFNQGGDWQISAIIDSNIEAQSSLLIHLDNRLTFTPPTALSTGRYGINFTAAKADRTPFVIFGEPTASRLEVAAAILEALADLRFASGGDATGELTLRGEVRGGRLVVDVSEGDGFLNQVLAGIRIDSEFALGFGVSSLDGIFFVGSSTLEIQLPAHINLGPVEINALTFTIGLSNAGFPIGLSTNLKFDLGPLTAAVEGIGIRGLLTIADDRAGGNLGPVDLDLGFKPPSGVGLSIDAGVVKGGGYLSFDFDKEEYAGALELDFSGIITVKAIGLITTRLPDGSKGFSLLIIISAEFGSPIQLGFGFTLIGLGGLLGLNRTMRIDLLAEGVRSGSVESIMFPTDIIANITRIISDLRSFFPPAKDRFLVGPMAKLGWGTPTLVSLTLGVIVEIPPGNIVILGVLKVALPDEDAALLVLQVNFIGAFEPTKQRLWFFASLYESRVIFITLDGEMGLLVAWGNDADFVVSVGGFHPQFTPPPLPFPAPKRIAISILNESFARIRVEGYFAVTSNSAQFGARVEIFFGVSDFNIEGHLGFDALFQFSPFYFIVSISTSLSVKVFGVGLFSVRFRGELEGTSPYHIEGEGSISILFFSIDVPFSHTWGDRVDTVLPPIEVMPLLETEFNKRDNWTAIVPGADNLLVSLRKIDATEELVLHPIGRLRISQRAVPLDLRLDKIGSQKPSDVNRVEVQLSDTDLALKSRSQEQFAMAQFLELSDGDKLSRQPYEIEEAGVELSAGGDELRTGHAVKRSVRYELIIIDSNFKEHLQHFFVFVGSLFAHFLRGNAATRSVLSFHYKTQMTPVEQKVVAGTAGFAVVSAVDNTLLNEEAAFSSQAKAIDYMQTRISGDPSLTDEIQVIPMAEMRGPA